MRSTASTPHEHVREVLLTDTVLTVLGFDHRNVGDTVPQPGPAIVLSWSPEWYCSPAAAMGTLVVDVVGVDVRTRDAVLDRVAVALGSAAGGPVRRIRRDGESGGSFTVLAHVGGGHPTTGSRSVAAAM